MAGFNDAVGKSFAGKSTEPGGGGRAAKLDSELASKGMPKAERGAIIGKEGRAKFGAKKMGKWSAAGRKRGEK